MTINKKIKIQGGSPLGRLPYACAECKLEEKTKQPLINRWSQAKWVERPQSMSLCDRCVFVGWRYVKHTPSSSSQNSVLVYMYGALCCRDLETHIHTCIYIYIYIHIKNIHIQTRACKPACSAGCFKLTVRRGPGNQAPAKPNFEPLSQLTKKVPSELIAKILQSTKLPWTCWAKLCSYNQPFQTRIVTHALQNKNLRDEMMEAEYTVMKPAKFKRNFCDLVILFLEILLLMSTAD